MLTQIPPVLVMLRLKQVIERTGLSRSTIYGKLDSKSTQYDPNFPTQIPLGSSAVRWVDAEINAWLEQCVNSSRVNNSGAFAKIDRKVRNRNVSVV